MRSFSFRHLIPRLATALAWTAATVGGQAPIGPVRVTPDRGAPLGLESFVQRVLATDPQLSVAQERVHAAEGGRRTARAWTNPALSYQVENAGFPGRAAASGLDRETSLFAMLPLEPLFQLGARSARANAEVSIAESELSATRRNVALNAVAAFYRAANAQVMVDATLDIHRWLDSLIAYTRNRVREGAAAEVDLMRLEVELGRAETDFALARVDAAKAQAELSSLSGARTVVIEVRDPGDDAPSRLELPALDVLLALAHRQRPETHAASAQIVAATSSLRLERRSLVRDVGVMAGIKTMAGTGSFMFGASTTLPLFNRNGGEIQRADAERRAATFTRDAVDRQVTADVTAAYDAARTLNEQASDVRRTLLVRAQEGRRIAEAAYREGATSLVQVIDAARTFAEAREVTYRALFARRQSLIELNAAIGAADLTAVLVVTSPTGSATSRTEVAR